MAPSGSGCLFWVDGCPSGWVCVVCGCTWWVCVPLGGWRQWVFPVHVSLVGVQVFLPLGWVSCIGCMSLGGDACSQWVSMVGVPSVCLCVCPQWVSWHISWLVSPCGAVQGGQCRRLVSTRLRSHLPQPESCQLPVPPSDQLCRPHGHLPPRGGDIGGHGGVHGDRGGLM